MKKSKEKSKAAPEPVAEEPGHFRKSMLRDYFESILIAVIFALFVRTFVVQAFKIPSSSMEENLLVGDHILVNKFGFGPHPDWMENVLPYREVRRSDVIVFKYPRNAHRDFIKRVIGLPGDSIEIRSGDVVRNDERLDEPYTVIKQPPGSRADWERLYRTTRRSRIEIPEGQYYAMGDNRLNSEDSRFWGTVPEDFVIGNAVLIYWSFDVPDHLKSVEVDTNATSVDKGRSLGYTFIHFVTRTRWRRTLQLVR